MGCLRVILVTCSVPQGTVLGPQLSVLYTAELMDIVARYKMALHAFADDHRLYIRCLVEDVPSAAANVEQRVAAIEHWMSANRLRLNADKAELIWTGAKHNLLKIPDGGPSLTLAEPTSSHLTSLVCLECCSIQTCRRTSTSPHSVQSASSSCNNYAVSDARSVTTPSPHWFTRSSPTASTTVSVYWPARSPQKTTAKLQRVLNAAARVVSNCGKYDRGLSHFRRRVLHRLDVTDRIRFRLCVQVYKCQHSVAPGYLVDLCRPVSSGDAENAGLENAGLENEGPNRRGGNRRTGKHGNIICMDSQT